MKTTKKRATDLQPGDRIVRQETFPNSLYQGIVKSTTIVDGGVQIVLLDGRYTRPEDTLFEVKTP